MSRTGSRLAFVLALAALASAQVLAQGSIEDELPEKPAKYITDRAGILWAERVDVLSAKLEQFERETSNQILVWVDRKLPERFTLEDFAVRAAEKWKAGQAKTDNGAILFVFVDDRKLRIEVGYGLEGVIPDAIAKRIIDDEIVPRFRSGDYAGGIEAGVDAMIAATKGEYEGTGSTVAERSGRHRTSLVEWLERVVPGIEVVLVFILALLGSRRLSSRRRRRTFGGSGWWTGMGGGGWSGGGGGWSGGGGGGGGFSGGGGSFGGGGASGSW